MTRSAKKIKPKVSAKEQTLRELEEKVSQKGIQIHYDKLETAGLKLKGGLCKVRGKLHLYIDRRKSIDEKIALLRDYYMEPLEDLFESISNDPAQNEK